MCISCGNDRGYLSHAMEHSGQTNLVIFKHSSFYNVFPFPGLNSSRFNVAYDVKSVMIRFCITIILMIFLQCCVIIYAINLYIC